MAKAKLGRLLYAEGYIGLHTAIYEYQNYDKAEADKKFQQLSELALWDIEPKFISLFI